MKGLSERLHGLRWRLAATRLLWKAGAGPELPFPTDAFDAAPRGELDEPEAGATLERQMLPIRGWTLFPSAPNVQVEAWLGERPLGRARIGVGRPDVQKLSRNPFAAGSGFDLTADLSAWEGPDGETVLRVVATSAEGRQHELSLTVTISSDSVTETASPKALQPPAALTPRSSGGGKRRVLVCTHQLNLGGAQLYLLDLLRELIRQGGAEPTVTSPMDGRLRVDLEELGVPVHVSSPVPGDNLSSHIGRVEELAAWASGRDFEAAFVNTATALSFPGAEAAALLGIPAVWAIHESFPPSVLWGDLGSGVRRRAEEALEGAALVLFEAEATKRIFESKIGAGRSVMLPYGIDLEPIDRSRAKFDRAALRREAGVPEDAELVICVGTVEPRKAQIPLAQAFDLIADRHPKARLVFVGGRDDLDSRALLALIGASGARDRIELIPVTPDVQPWYEIADLLICASDIESLPRTVLEAMASETPVLATSVFGLPELIEDGETGWLCEPRDIGALAVALDRALSSTSEERQRIGQAARQLVEHRHSLEDYGREVGRLLDQVASGGAPELSTHATAG